MKTFLRPVLLCALLSPAVSARPIAVERTWDELSVTVRDRWIDLVLPDHTRLRGQALRVTPEALVMEVRRSSNHTLYPRGRMEIPRASVTKLDVIIFRDPDPGAHRGGIWGGVAGIIFSQAPVLVLEEDGHDVAAGAVFVAMIAIGAYVGHRLFDRNHDAGNRRTVTIIESVINDAPRDGSE